MFILFFTNYHLSQMPSSLQTAFYFPWTCFSSNDTGLNLSSGAECGAFVRADTKCSVFTVIDTHNGGTGE